jgi:hypothetical protein
MVRSPMSSIASLRGGLARAGLIFVSRHVNARLNAQPQALRAVPARKSEAAVVEPDGCPLEAISNDFSRMFHRSIGQWLQHLFRLPT